jgi:signal transduction protein with GAF and PtsI domain
VAKVKDFESRLERLEHQLGVYQRVSRLMVRELSLADTLQGIAKLVQEFTDCDSCLIYLIENGELVLCATNNPHPTQIGRVRLKLDEGLTGWVARERKLLAISMEAYKDARFKGFSDLPEDSYEAFLSAPVIARNRVVGVINVQHRATHRHSGAEMELLTTVGEQVGCLLVLARMAPTAIEEANHVELVRSHGHIARRGEDPAGKE